MIDLEPSWKKYTLADTYDFAPEDLEANRQGVMSKRQKQREHEIYLVRKVGGPIQIIFILFCISLFAIEIYTLLPNSMRIPITPIVLIVFGAALFYIWPNIRPGRIFLVPQPIDRVNYATGTIDVDQAVQTYIGGRGRRRILLYMLTVEDLKFLVAPRKLYLFDKTKRYRVYFIRYSVPSTKTPSDYPSIRILSIEEVPEEQI